MTQRIPKTQQKNWIKLTNVIYPCQRPGCTDRVYVKFYNRPKNEFACPKCLNLPRVTGTNIPANYYTHCSYCQVWFKCMQNYNGHKVLCPVHRNGEDAKIQGICTSCGKMGLISYVADPCRKEIYDEIILKWIDAACYEENCNDI